MIAPLCGGAVRAWLAHRSGQAGGPATRVTVAELVVKNLRDRSERPGAARRTALGANISGVPEAASLSPLPFRRVEHHMSTAITLAGRGLDDAVADRFFTRIAALEAVLSRFRPDSDVSRLARGECSHDDVDPAVRTVLAGAEALRGLTGGDFEHEPQRASGRPDDPPLDVNAYAKGWIIEEAATVLRLAAAEFFVNAGGDIVTSARAGGTRWRV